MSYRDVLITNPGHWQLNRNGCKMLEIVGCIVLMSCVIERERRKPTTIIRLGIKINEWWELVTSIVHQFLRANIIYAHSIDFESVRDDNAKDHGV